MILTRDPQMECLIRTAMRVARTRLAVLLVGETGTGKERLAQFIGANSPRADKPYVSQNCAAIPLPLLESELFGYQRGAFTGANRDRRGAFDLADGGTLFLDEVGDLPAAAQPKILRVLEEGEIWPIGAEKPHRVDVRIIAATNHDLEAETRLGRFRRDLFYRLAVFPLVVPPLRSRPLDIPLLAEHFASVYGESCGRPRPVISAEAVARLHEHPFPGNVRELENLMARAVVMMGDEGVLRPEHLSGLDSGRSPTTYREQVRMFKGKLILDAIQREGSVVAAARSLGMSARNVNKLCHRLQLQGSVRSSGGSARCRSVNATQSKPATPAAMRS